MSQFERIEAFKNTFHKNGWNTFVGELGLFELQDLKENIWEHLILNDDNYKTFRTLYSLDKNKIDVIDYYFNVVPRGAGSSYMGALQQYLLYGKEVLTSERKNNLWDNDYNLQMTRRYSQIDNKIIRGISSAVTSNRIPSVEDMLREVISGHEVWYTIFENYYNILKSTIKDNGIFRQVEKVFVEFTVHDHLLLFDLFGNSKINLFIDCTWERFEWCHLLSYYKHYSTISKVRLGLIKAESKQAWKIYQLTKQYTKPIASFDYELLFIYRQEDVIHDFAYQTLQQKPTTEQIEYLIKHLKIYTDRNNQLMDKIKNEI